MCKNDAEKKTNFLRTWLLKIREHRLSFCDRRVLKKLCESNREEAAEGKRKLHKEGIRYL